MSVQAAEIVAPVGLMDFAFVRIDLAEFCGPLGFHECTDSLLLA